MAPAAWCLPLPTSCVLAASEGREVTLEKEGLLSVLPDLHSLLWHLLRVPASVVLSRLLCQPKPQP